jgi:hypothetical protein
LAKNEHTDVLDEAFAIAKAGAGISRGAAPDADASMNASVTDEELAHAKHEPNDADAAMKISATDDELAVAALNTIDPLPGKKESWKDVAHEVQKRKADAKEAKILERADKKAKADEMIQKKKDKAEAALKKKMADANALIKRRKALAEAEIAKMKEKAKQNGKNRLKTFLSETKEKMCAKDETKNAAKADETKDDVKENEKNGITDEEKNLGLDRIGCSRCKYYATGCNRCNWVKHRVYLKNCAAANKTVQDKK